MSYPQVTLDPDAGPPYIEIRVFYTLLGGYRVYRWRDAMPIEVGNGVTNDERPDLFPIGAGPRIDDRTILSVELLIIKTPGTDFPGDGPYRAEILVTQDDRHAAGSPYVVDGNLKDGRAARLQYLELKNS